MQKAMTKVQLDPFRSEQVFGHLLKLFRPPDGTAVKDAGEVQIDQRLLKTSLNVVKPAKFMASEQIEKLTVHGAIVLRRFLNRIAVGIRICVIVEIVAALFLPRTVQNCAGRDLYDAVLLQFHCMFSCESIESCNKITALTFAFLFFPDCIIARMLPKSLDSIQFFSAQSASCLRRIQH